MDSRLVQSGDLFFALPGARLDGHQFIQEAADKGAVAAVVDKALSLDSQKIPLIRVENPLKALQLIAKKILEARKTKVIAVTGSFGKTTAKDFISAILKKKFKIASSPGNSNSQIGLPLSILNHSQGDEDFFILEMGMTHSGHLADLVQVAPPDIALITAVALVHACNFDSIEAIGRAKGEIFSHPRTSLGILDRGIKNFEEVSRIGDCPKISFSCEDPHADYFLSPFSDGIKIFEKGKLSITLPSLPVPGQHNQHNFLAAVAVARAVGMDWKEISAAQSQLKLPDLRLQKVEKNGITFINDSYNASEKTVKAAFKSLPMPTEGGRRFAVIGEMLELGKFSESCHREVALDALNHVDMMLCMGKGCAPIYDVWQAAEKPVFWRFTREEIVHALRNQLQPGDVVLLKGSRSNQLWKVLEEL